MKHRKRKRLTPKIVAPVSYPVVVQTWAFYEGEQFIEINDWSVHLDNRDRDAYVEVYWERFKLTYRNRMPSGYLRDEGQPVPVLAKERIYKRLQELREAGKHGMLITHLDILGEKQE